MNNHDIEIYGLGYLRAAPINNYLSNLDSSGYFGTVSCYQKYPKCVQVFKFFTQNVVWDFGL
jgi:hypothetical protein